MRCINVQLFLWVEWLKGPLSPGADIFAQTHSNTLTYTWTVPAKGNGSAYAHRTTYAF